MHEEGYKKIIEALLSLIDAGVYIVDEEGVSMPDAPVPTRTYFIDCPAGLSAGDILRKRL